jgi:uncharacterized membrane protein
MNKISLVRKRVKGLPLLKILLVSAAASISLVVLRVFWSHQFTYLFLVWNLFLAWIPLLFVRALPQNTYRISVQLVLVLFLWLLFFPNSPYIITDLIHLKQTRNIPLWFDSLLIMSFAWNGLIVGFLSLLQIHNILVEKIRLSRSWIVIILLLMLSSFGVYLGRFERWNSWDLIMNPYQLLDNIFNLILHPIRNKEAVGVTFVFSIFLITSYSTFFYISNYHKHEQEFE